MIKAEIIYEIYTVVESLPPKCQQIIRLGYIQGMKNMDIAERLDISVSTVKTHKRLGLSILRRRLDSNLIF